MRLKWWSKLSSPGRPHRSRFTPRIESLEDRTVPATLDIIGGTLTYSESSGIDHQLVWSFDGTNYTITDTEDFTLVPAGWSGVGSTTATGPGTGLGITAESITTGTGSDTIQLQSIQENMTVSGGGGADTLIGPDAATIWNVTAANAGNLTVSGQPVNFSAVESLSCGTAADSLIFAAAGSVAGNINGGAAADTLDISAVANAIFNVTGPGSTDGFQGTASGIGGTFDNIDGFVPAQADLALTMTASSTIVIVGQTVTLTFTIQNNGPSTATAVSVVEPFPAASGLQFVFNSTPSQGSFSFNAGTLQGTWNVGTLTTGASATLEVVGQVTRSGLITNLAVADAAEVDAVLANNAAVIDLNGVLSSATLSKRSFLSSGQNGAPFVTTPIPNLTLSLADSPSVTELPAIFSDPNLSNSLLRLNTSAGPVDLVLFDAATPITVANFFNYVNSGRYDSTIFHRLVQSVGLSVLQGGGFELDTSGGPGSTDLPAVSTDQQIPSEFSSSRSNVFGTLAMATQFGNPDSATSQFFINLANNAATLDPQSFTVFGQLASSADPLVVNNLVSPPVTIRNQGIPFNEIPMIGTFPTFPGGTTAANYDLLGSVTILRQTEELTYSVVSVVNDGGNPGTVVNAAISNGFRLVVTPVSVGGATITVRATDRSGAYVDTQFHVTVQ